MLSLMWNNQVFHETATFFIGLRPSLVTDETGLLAFRFYSGTHFTLIMERSRDSLMFTVGSSVHHM